MLESQRGVSPTRPTIKLKQFMTAYEILDVDRKDPNRLEKIKTNYRHLAKRWHPDRPQGMKELFSLINEAYSRIGDTAARVRYDQSGTFRNGDRDVPKIDMTVVCISLGYLRDDGQTPTGRNYAFQLTDKIQAESIPVSTFEPAETIECEKNFTPLSRNPSGLRAEPKAFSQSELDYTEHNHEQTF